MEKNKWNEFKETYKNSLLTSKIISKGEKLLVFKETYINFSF